MPTIVVTDTDFGDSEFERQMIEAAGITFRAYNEPDGRHPTQIIEHLRKADGAITSYGEYSAEVFAALPQLKVVSKTGTGIDNIDVIAATKNGTRVCNVPCYGTEVVSDHAIALAMCVLRRINEIDADMRAGIWNFRRHRPLGQAHGRTFGVVGMGNIGQAVARKARGLGFSVIAWDRSGTPNCTSPDGFTYTTFENLLRESDVVSFHTALAPQTRHMLNAQNIGIMKPDAVVINTSRGAVIDTDALAEALFNDKLWGAGIDVFEDEPVDPASPICQAPHTVLTSHAAYWSEESAVELRRRCTQNAIDVVLGRTPENCVN
ncbi:C-terminal binding protein [Adlercreutzia sp. ZJ304]|uniref:C-terminal binding protein n=1 Tax=Adlercreutzia sp. ZJ304 TaxID=2709791 RepID=UPI0013ECF855|nr:C-terminal binding protein [Adlercreutzia sp. ZJ304]